MKSTATKPKTISKTVPTAILESGPSPGAEDRLGAEAEFEEQIEH